MYAFMIYFYRDFDVYLSRMRIINSLFLMNEMIILCNRRLDHDNNRYIDTRIDISKLFRIRICSYNKVVDPQVVKDWKL